MTVLLRGNMECNTVIAYMWQSWVEIEHYFVLYFDRITTFVAL